ncbi:adhesion G protein-coupled receptor L4-like [Dendronephthya gigantea]|uniref:adhesion G protein-coupled receptor L4-like n=1 Tax=Dendronephthya gigantea TaxID=151771 RepID=UPI00106B60C6|nr:adhesion G protein-coupled receptor L4-like [Dendronephthya gigantea]XP_028393578.1 adhesion G protein-coupled receptor L4-like [Dendronephthya gigantea]
MNKMIIVYLSLFLYQGHVFSQEFVANGTSHVNVTGCIRIRERNAWDVLDRESDVYKDIAKNLTRGFVNFFPNYFRWVHLNVTVEELFIWPTFPEKKDAKNLSFVIIARNKYKTTSFERKAEAEFELPNSLFWYNWHHIHTDKDSEGFVTLEGLKVKYKDIDLLPEPIVENVTLNYMAFITKLRNANSNGEGDETPTRSPSGNSSVEGSFNTSVSPSEPKEPREISYIAYIGITLSMIGLLITMTSICFFRRLRKFRRNQILVHICVTIMAGMLLSILSFTYEGNKSYCTALAQLLHYFILAAVSWMCVEAYNLYRDLVKVFNTTTLSGRGFTLRACICGYGLPAVIVGVTSAVDIRFYGRRNDACWMTSSAFFVSFLTPVLLTVFVNIVFFGLIMREIIQISQRDANNIRSSLRAAVSLSVVFGFCWLLAGISTFTTNPLVTYAFVILSSFQGLFIFIFHGIGKQELRDSWKSLPIFKWQFNKFSNTEIQGRGKTESTTQDTPQMPKRCSTDAVGKLREDYFSAFDAGFRSACDAGHNTAYAKESILNSNEHNDEIPDLHEKKHSVLKKIESNC